MDRLKAGQSTIADTHPNVTVLMADMVAFSDVSRASSMPELIIMLSGLFEEFDALAEQHGVFKARRPGHPQRAPPPGLVARGTRPRPRRCLRCAPRRPPCGTQYRGLAALRGG